MPRPSPPPEGKMHQPGNQLQERSRSIDRRQDRVHIVNNAVEPGVVDPEARTRGLTVRDSGSDEVLAPLGIRGGGVRVAGNFVLAPPRSAH